MGKRLSLAAVIGVLLGALWAAPAMAADALTSCIQSTTVCVADGSSIDNESAVAAALKDKAHVAVVSNDDSNSLNPNQLATQLAQSSGTKELILVVDMGSSDRFGVYSQSGQGDEILKALNGAGQSDGGEAIVSSDVASIYSTPAAGNGSDGGGLGVLGVLAIIGAAVILTGAALVITIGTRDRRRDARAIEASKPSRAAIAAQRSVELSEELKSEIAKISKTMERYQRSEDSKLREAGFLLQPIHDHIYELFGRIDKKNARQNREIAQVRYLNITKKLNSTLSADYFEDMVRKPELWDESDQKITGVLTALRSVDKQIIENIKQVNSSKEIEFRVAVDSLIGTEEIAVEEVYGQEKGSKEKLPRSFGV